MLAAAAGAVGLWLDQGLAAAMDACNR
jgi:hypothetical protein